MEKKYSYSVLTLIFLTIYGYLIFQNSLNGKFIWDDEAQILHNPFITSLKNIPLLFTGGTFYIENSQQALQGVYYRPLMTLFYTLIYHFFGLNPFAFHAVQLIIHILNAFLLFLLFLRLIKWRNNITPFLLSVLFLIHPMNSETVSYIANLQDVLFFFFGILSLHFLISRKANIRNYSISFLFLFLSFLSKETALVFVFISTIYIYLLNRKLLKLTIVLNFFLIIVYAYLRCGLAHICTSAHKPNPVGDLPFLMYLANVPILSFYYIKTFFAPLTLAIGQCWVVKSFGWKNFYIPLIIMSGISVYLLFVLFKLYIQKHLYKKLYVFFVSWFCLSLLFHMHIVPLDFTVSDRWFYLPMAGLIATFGLLLHIYEEKKSLVPILSILCVVIVLFSCKTYQRNFDWKDNFTLFSRDIYKSENSFNMENNLGVELFRRKKHDEALIHFKKAAELAPDWHTPWTNIGIIYHLKKQYSKAEFAYKKAIELHGLYKAYQNYISLLVEEGKTKDALRFIETVALKEFPNNVNLIQTYNKLKKDIK